MNAFILNHLENQLDLINIVNILTFESLRILVLLLDCLNFFASKTPINPTKQALCKVIHGGGFSARLLFLRDAINGGNVSNQSLRHIVNQSHLCAMWDVDTGSKGWRCKHSDQRHSVHVVRD